MEWHFDLAWFITGVVLIVAGALIIRLHDKVADNFAHGVTSYGKTKVAGLIAIILGFLFMTNLHTVLLYAFLKFIMPTVFTK